MIHRIASRLKDKVKEAGISEYELSRRSGVSRQTIRNILNADTNLTLNSLEALCEALGITIEEVISKTNNMRHKSEIEWRDKMIAQLREEIKFLRSQISGKEVKVNRRSA